jgi:hypothetical protein
MDELEGRLRSALAEMAEEVPPSHHAWAEHQRRVAAKSRRDRRRPVLMAAAAAAVVALIAVPTLILNTRGTDTEQAGQAPPSGSGWTPTAPTQPGRASVLPSPKYVARPGETVVTEPFLLTGADKIGGVTNTYVYTVRRDGLVQLCVVTQPNSAGNVVDGSKGHPDFCAALTRPAQGKYFWSGGIVVPQAPNTYLYVASPPAEKILVREPDGSYAAAVRYVQSGEFSVFSSAAGLEKPTAYSALDAAGNALENR